jgi:hypothetical protein
MQGIHFTLAALSDLQPFTLDYFVGDTVGIRATFTLDGAAYDLTGCGLTFRVRDESTSGVTIVWDRRIGQGIAVTSAVGGIALISPSTLESAALVAGRTYSASAVLTDSAGTIITTAIGYLIAR